MKKESDNIDRAADGTEVDDVDDLCEACCCFEVEECDVLHAKGCKVGTTCCW